MREHSWPPARAQFQNPITAAKDAYKKSKQESQQKQQQPQGQAQGQQQQQSPATQNADGAAAAADPQAAGDCCSADAQAKAAAVASFLDIVGIKLGMTPEEATAAIKAYDPTMKFGVVNTRLERPSNPQGFVRVPRYIFVQSANLSAANGQVERITIQFTTPPNPPVVQWVERYVQFRVGEPVLASNLMDGIHKKYGQENSGSPGGPVWVYDSNGKLLTQVPNVSCQPNNSLSSVIVPSDLTHDAQDGGISLSDTVDNSGIGLTPDCVPYLYAQAWGTGLTPNDKITALTISIWSGALRYDSLKSTHKWLQSEADAIQKKQNSDAAGRAGPKF